MDLTKAIDTLRRAHSQAVENNTPVAIPRDAAFPIIRFHGEMTKTQRNQYQKAWNRRVKAKAKAAKARERREEKELRRAAAAQAALDTGLMTSEDKQAINSFIADQHAAPPVTAPEAAGSNDASATEGEVEL